MGDKNVRISLEKSFILEQRNGVTGRGKMGVNGKFSFLNISRTGARLHANDKEPTERKKLRT